MTPITFFPLAALIIASALGVILNRHPIRSALCLAVTLFLLAAMFVFLDAHLVAALQIIVYAGAILVLFLFVIMLLNLEADLPQKRRRNLVIAASAGGVVFTGVTLRALFFTGGELPGPGTDASVPADFGTATAIGERLFTHFVLPFEITSVLLLVAVLGAVVLAKKKIS
jgi:NADH-quinone oxidoreductase subunit J